MRPQPMVTFPVWNKRKTEPDPKLCFVLMPFGKRHLDRAFQAVVVPVAAELGVEATRADHGPEEIMEGIWSRMLDARVVIADVTGENPNVMYELGIAHAVGKPILLLSAGGDDDITFDLRRYRHVFYTTSPRGLEKLRTELRRELKVLLDQHPTGSRLLDEIEYYAQEWSERNHDSFSLHPEVVNQARGLLPVEQMTDLAIAYATATGAHYGSTDHMIFWGRHCARRPAAAIELAMLALPGKARRPALRTLRLIEQFPPESQDKAVERLIEHRANADLVAAVRERRLTEFLRDHGGELSMLPEEIPVLLEQLPNIRLAT